MQVLICQKYPRKCASSLGLSSILFERVAFWGDNFRQSRIISKSENFLYSNHRKTRERFSNLSESYNKKIYIRKKSNSISAKPIHLELNFLFSLKILQRWVVQSAKRKDQKNRFFGILGAQLIAPQKSVGNHGNMVPRGWKGSSIEYNIMLGLCIFSFSYGRS